MTDLDRKSLLKAQKVIEEFRKIDENMPIQQAAVFLAIALNNNIAQKEIAEKTGMSQGSVSRNVSAFLKLNRFKRKGFDLVESTPDPMELRKKHHKLNMRGQRVAQAIIDAVF